jgi:Holliday junction resolvase
MPTDGARLLQEVLSELGWSADAAAVANKVRLLNFGLPLEDEFSVVCAWLGKCQLLHKLEQLQIPPASRQEYQVPDLLAKFSTQTNNSSPVLIEVKGKTDNVLSFKPEYLQRLQNYADLLGMPLLIAWKFHGMWMLFEVRHMRKVVKNFNITLSDAMRENLLGVLAGDVAYKIGAGAGVHLRLRKDRLVEAEESGGSRTEEWSMTIDDVFFTDRQGNRRADLNSEVQSLFTAWDLEQKEEHTDSHVHVHFVAGEEGILFGHMALVRLLAWELPQEEQPHWRSLLRKEKVTANVENFSATLRVALREQIVSHVLNFQPNTMPAFLPTS